MIYLIKEKIRLYRLNKKLRKADIYDKLIKQSKTGGKIREDIDRIKREGDADCDNYRHEIARIKTSRLLRKTSKLNLPLPTYYDEELWEPGISGIPS